MRPIVPRRLAAVVAFVAMAAFVASSCGSFVRPDEEPMSFAAMQSLNRGVSGEWILREFPHAREVVRDPRTGLLRRLGYWVKDPAADNHALVLHFDDRGILERKVYDGPLLRPPADQPAPETPR